MLRTTSDRCRKLNVSPHAAGRKALALVDLCTVRQLPETILDEVDLPLTAFLRAAESRIRSQAASALAQYDWAPRETLRALAFDAYEVSEPILKHSPCLSAQDLIALAGLGPEQRCALAQRQCVSPSLCGALSAHKEPRCLMTLAQNRGAELGEACAPDFAALIKGDKALQQALEDRGTLNEAFAQALFDIAGDSVRRIIERTCPGIFETHLESLAVSPFKDDEEDLHQMQDTLASDLHEIGALTPQDVLRATHNGRSDIVDHAVARLTGLEAADWRQALHRSPVRAIYLAARAMAMPVEDAQRFHKALSEIGRAHKLSDADMTRAADEFYTRYNRDSARKTLHRMSADASIS